MGMEFCRFKTTDVLRCMMPLGKNCVQRISQPTGCYLPVCIYGSASGELPQQVVNLLCTPAETPAMQSTAYDLPACMYQMHHLQYVSYSLFVQGSILRVHAICGHNSQVGCTHVLHPPPSAWSLLTRLPETSQTGVILLVRASVRPRSGTCQSSPSGEGLDFRRRPTVDQLNNGFMQRRRSVRTSAADGLYEQLPRDVHAVVLSEQLE